jgi:hypothetical protein
MSWSLLAWAVPEGWQVGSQAGVIISYAGQQAAIWRIRLGAWRAAAISPRAARPVAVSHRLSAANPVGPSAINGKAIQMRRNTAASTEAVSS